ncbi:MAG TPA: sigma-70 family RNA polymerase sigma factor [Bacteroidota bacterium]|nr:sigma-70 family RNA polymerase sigma factor [Bacteroidota bacterium]
MLAQAADNSAVHKSDEVLITLFQTGERDVFRLLVERYQERVRNIIYSIFHEQAIIDDLAQEVFLKAYQALPRFRFESSFYTWLYRITVNKSRDELRKRKVRRYFTLQPLDESAEKEIAGKSESQGLKEDAQELITEGLKKIPDKFRLPIVLKDIEGMTYEEIAEVMQCEIGTVKSRLSRGRAMLRSALKPLLED